MEHRTSLEVIAPTVHEAIEKGLVELGLDLRGIITGLCHWRANGIRRKPDEY